MINFVTNAYRQVHIPQTIATTIQKDFLKIIGSPYEYEKNLDRLTFTATQILERHLPQNVKQKIEQVKESDIGYCEITGIPTDPDLMDTPKNLGEMNKKRTFVPELFSLGVCGLLKQELYNFRQEGWGTGNLIFNIFPKKNMLNIKGAGGVGGDFGFHMEDAWHPQTPDMLMLKGVRQDHEKAALTYAVANKVIFDALSSEDRKALMEPCFAIHAPEIHRKMEFEEGVIFSEDKPYEGPVIVPERTGYKFMANFNGMNALEADGVHAKALERFRVLADELRSHVKLREDNLLVINNKRALHTRNSYVPRFDGKDRWFQRYYLIDAKNLWRHLQIAGTDFPFLTDELRNDLMNRLEAQGITKNNVLTAKFSPHVRLFELELPESLLPYRLEIMKVLLRKGPAHPHRII